MKNLKNDAAVAVNVETVDDETESGFPDRLDPYQVLQEMLRDPELNSSLAPDQLLKMKGFDPDLTGRWSVVRMHGTYGSETNLVRVGATEWGPFEDDENSTGFEVGYWSGLDTIAMPDGKPSNPDETGQKATIVIQYRLVAAAPGYREI